MKKNLFSLLGLSVVLCMVTGCATSEPPTLSPYAQMADILNQQIAILDDQYQETSRQYEAGTAELNTVYRARLQLDDVRLELWSLHNGNLGRARLIQTILHRNIALLELKYAELGHQSGNVSKENLTRSRLTLLQLQKQLLSAPKNIKKANDFPALEKALSSYPDMSNAQLQAILQGKYDK